MTTPQNPYADALLSKLGQKNTGVAGPAPMQAPTPQPASIGSVLPFLQQHYRHTPADLQRAFSERPEMFHGASILGSKGDKIRFADGRVYDVIQAAGEGGKGWQALWDNDPNARPAAPMMGGGFTLPTDVNSLLAGNPLAAIQAAIAQQATPGDENLRALLASLGQ